MSALKLAAVLLSCGGVESSLYSYTSYTTQGTSSGQGMLGWKKLVMAGKKSRGTVEVKSSTSYTQQLLLHCTIHTILATVVVL